MRKVGLVAGKIYHICTKSIAGFKIFNNDSDFERMQQLIKYYQVENYVKFSDFMASKIVRQNGFNNAFEIISKDKNQLVQIIAYCFMPTHIHLIVKQLAGDGISRYMKDILISYTRSFNLNHKRKGPLWESRFKNILVKSDEQLYHLTRYLHLNPVTAKFINHPENWLFSSYHEYIEKVPDMQTICQFSDTMEIRPSSYRKFVNDQISYQRELAEIKKLLLE